MRKLFLLVVTGASAVAAYMWLRGRDLSKVVDRANDAIGKAHGDLDRAANAASDAAKYRPAPAS